MTSSKKVFLKASERIRTEIEQDIRDGTLLPGEPIDDVELAQRYGVSRTPVREALIQLQAQGLLTSQPRGGTMVAKMSLQQLLALWELLAELEGVAVRLACERMTAEELAAIQRNHEASRQAAETDDVTGWQDFNLRFHELIYQATRNPFLRQEVLRIRARTGVYRKHAFGALGRIQTSFEQHAQVVDALQRRDAAAATQAMVHHLHPVRDARELTDVIVALPKELLGP